MVLLSVRDFERAKPFLERYLVDNPKNASAHFFMGETLDQEGDLSALYHYKAALRNMLSASNKEYKEMRWEDVQAKYGDIVGHIQGKIRKYELLSKGEQDTTRNVSYLSRYALVIGNSGYSTGELRNPINDAKDVSIELHNLGFEVTLKTDVSNVELKNSIRSFGEKVKESPGVALFYYAGHGTQFEGKNYLIPIDANIKYQYEIEDNCVRADQILRMLKFLDNPMNIIILDACRNNPYSSDVRSQSNGLAVPDIAPRGSIIAFATAPGKVASDGQNRNGLYTQELLKALRKPGLSIEQLFKEVRVNVINISNGDQIPWETSSLVGEFYFTPIEKH